MKRGARRGTYIAGVLGALVCLLMLWGSLIEPRWLDEVHERAELPKLPPTWVGKRIAVIADLQLGMWLGNETTVRRSIERLLTMRPELVLVAGDFVYHPTEDDDSREAREEFDAEQQRELRELVRQVTDLLAPLGRQGIATYAVLGNHDYGMQNPSALKLPWVADELSRALERTGVHVLRNEAVPLSGGLYLVGIDSFYAGEDDVARALADVPSQAPRIVFMHNPQSFPKFPGGTAPLAVAAHTHGGQIRIPLLPSWSWLELVREHEVHADGWIQGFGRPGNRLYVNRGLGFSILPVRINCRPELTVFTLTSAPRD